MDNTAETELGCILKLVSIPSVIFFPDLGNFKTLLNLRIYAGHQELKEKECDWRKNVVQLKKMLLKKLANRCGITKFSELEKDLLQFVKD